MFNTLKSLKLDKNKTEYRTEYIRYCPAKNFDNDDYDYKYISSNDVCLVISYDNAYRKVWIGHKCIDFEDDEYVLFNTEPDLIDIKNIYRQLKREKKLNILYFL